MRYPDDEQAIILKNLWPSSAHPIRLRGRFKGAELVFVRAPISPTPYFGVLAFRAQNRRTSWTRF
jgi:hypothetical protein